jgi:hypothetical protein
MPGAAIVVRGLGAFKRARHAACSSGVGREPRLKKAQRSDSMARKYGKKASEIVERAMHEEKRGQLRSGRSGKRVTSREQAIAIGLSEARKAGAKVPPRRGGSSRRRSSSRRSSR